MKFPSHCVVLTLPEPPTLNHAYGLGVTYKWRKGRKVVVPFQYMTDKGKDWKKQAHNAALAVGLRPIPKPAKVAIYMTWYRGRKAGDLSNRMKLAEDSLQGAAYDNDKQVFEVHQFMSDDEPHNPRIEVCVVPLDDVQEVMLDD